MTKKRDDSKTSGEDDAVTAWLAQGAQGDLEAENRALEKLLPSLRRHARWRIGLEARGRDLQPDGLIDTAYRSIMRSPTKPPAFKSRQEFVSLVKRRMHDKLIDGGRQLTRDAVRARKGAGIKAAGVAGDSPAPQGGNGRRVEVPIDQVEQLAERRDPSGDRVAARAREALAGLKAAAPAAHQLLMLHYRDGHSWEEVARAIGKPLGTTKRMATEARKRLRDEFM